MYRYILFIILLFSLTLSARSKKIGYVVEIKGDVHVYRDVGVRTSKKKRVKIVKMGALKKQHFLALKYEKLYANDIIQTTTASKAKLVLKNKDVIFLKEYTKLVLPKDIGKRKNSSLLDLAFGKVRGIVVKSQKEKMRVPTPAAVMGVRGTDFVIGYSPYKHKTEVSVLRGEVSLEKREEPVKKVAKEKVLKDKKLKKEVVKKVVQPKPKKVIIKAGHTAAIKSKPVVKQEVPDAPLKEKAKIPEPPVEVEITQPEKITLQTLDEAKVIAMVKPEVKGKKAVKETPELVEAKKEALISEKKAEEKIKKDILKTSPKEMKIKKKEATDKKTGRVYLDATLDKLLDSKLSDEGLDKKAYKEVPVEIRVKAREKGVKDKEITPRKIREKSITDPEVKSIFDSYMEVF